MKNGELVDHVGEAAFNATNSIDIPMVMAVTTNSKTFPESTSRTQTQTWTIPNVKSVSSVKVSSGNVSYSVSGSTVTFNLSNGTVTRTQLTGGSYTPADTKTVNQTIRYYLKQYSKWNGTQWVLSRETLSPYSSVQSSISYNSGGYVGSLGQNGYNYVDSEGYPSPSNPSVGQEYQSASASVDYYYSGPVTRPASDTRTYAYYYQYTVTIDYVVNTNPILNITPPPNNQTLSQGTPFQLIGSASDTDNGNVLTVKYKINSGPIKALQSGISNGSTPLSFDRTLTYRNKRMYDWETDVTGADLAENADHVLTVWAEDDQGGKSAEITRQFRVIWNRPPVIDGENTNLGSIKTLPEIEYSATDPEDNPITFTEYLNGKQLRSFEGTPGQKYSLTLDHDTWIRLDLDIAHQLKIRATDSAGLYSERIYTFTRTETHIEFMLDLNNPNVRTHFQVDGKPERVLLTLDNYMPIGAVIESVKVCNNALDENPAWEDATGAVKGGRGHLFTNQTKTAEAWCINLWVTIAKGSATERVKLNGYGGAFD